MIYIQSNNNINTAKQLENKNSNKNNVVFNGLKSLISGFEDQNSRLLSQEDIQEKDSVIIQHVRDLYGSSYVDSVCNNNNNDKYRDKILKLFRCDSSLRNNDKIQATRITQSELDNKDLLHKTKVSYNVCCNGYPQLVDKIISNIANSSIDIINNNDGYDFIQNCIARNIGNNNMNAEKCRKQVRKFCTDMIECLLQKSILEQNFVSQLNLDELYIMFAKELESTELHSIFLPELPRFLFDFLNLYGDKMLFQVYKNLKKYRKFKDECNKYDDKFNKKESNKEDNLNNNDNIINTSQQDDESHKSDDSLNDSLNIDNHPEETLEDKSENSYKKLKKRILDKIKNNANKGLGMIKSKQSESKKELNNSNNLDLNNNLNDDTTIIQDLLSNLTAASLIIHTE